MNHYTVQYVTTDQQHLVLVIPARTARDAGKQVAHQPNVNYIKHVLLAVKQC